MNCSTFVGLVAAALCIFPAPKNLTAALFLRKGRRTHGGEEERAIQRNIDRSDKKNNNDKDEPGVMQAGARLYPAVAS
jgi:hypothetical protein